jgi:hypothetical protein
MPNDLRPFVLARAAAAAITDDEEQERALDQDEDRACEAEHQPVGVSDSLCGG